MSTYLPSTYTIFRNQGIVIIIYAVLEFGKKFHISVNNIFTIIKIKIVIFWKYKNLKKFEHFNVYKLHKKNYQNIL